MPTAAPRSMLQPRSTTRRSVKFRRERSRPGVKEPGCPECLRCLQCPAPRAPPWLRLLTASAQAFAQPPDGLNASSGSAARCFRSHAASATCRPPVARELTARARQDVSGGKDDLVRKVILEGTPRMPGFKASTRPDRRDRCVHQNVPAPAPVRGSAALLRGGAQPRLAEPTP